MPQPRAVVPASCIRWGLNTSGSLIEKYYLVQLKAGAFEEIELPGSATAAVDGVLLEDAPITGRLVDVRRSYQTDGMAVCIAGAAIAVNALVMPTTAGKVVTRTGTNTIVGKAKTAATADGDEIEVELMLQVGA
jgi:hypothetical protein